MDAPARRVRPPGPRSARAYRLPGRLRSPAGPSGADAGCAVLPS